MEEEKPSPETLRSFIATRPLSTGGLIIGFYALLILVDILVPVALWGSLQD